jgi:hypothetical protein
VRAGTVPATDYLALVLSLAAAGEQDLVVWTQIDGGVGTLLNALSRVPGAVEKFHLFIQKVYAPLADRLTWTPAADESQQTSVLRGRILQRLGRSGHEATVTHARQLFRQHVDDGLQLHADLRRTVSSDVSYIIARYRSADLFYCRACRWRRHFRFIATYV